ncbi:basic salivary proline-rich protein 2-like [Austrofundulus limnaeus]|uniref:Basic salivary proline-rich protein 2-like n=1 Tax=Austrofundulus limnaeus TaxID=52670 RepID=A0A2I4D639_AUSLI|nr:PREDICTED: basic salivary proline-rich protein 2-like [Austrofundulus limnaeus]
MPKHPAPDIESHQRTSRQRYTPTEGSATGEVKPTTSSGPSDKTDATLHSPSQYTHYTPQVQDTYPPPTEGRSYLNPGGKPIHTGMEKSRQPRPGLGCTRQTARPGEPQTMDKNKAQGNTREGCKQSIHPRAIQTPKTRPPATQSALNQKRPPNPSKEGSAVSAHPAASRARRHRERAPPQRRDQPAAPHTEGSQSRAGHQGTKRPEPGNRPPGPKSPSPEQDHSPGAARPQNPKSPVPIPKPPQHSKTTGSVTYDCRYRPPEGPHAATRRSPPKPPMPTPGRE